MQVLLGRRALVDVVVAMAAFLASGSWILTAAGAGATYFLSAIAAGLVQEVGRDRLVRLHELLVTAIDTVSVVEGGRSKAEEALAARAAREAMLRSETPEARAERQARAAESVRAGEAKLQAGENGPKLAGS